MLIFLEGGDGVDVVLDERLVEPVEDLVDGCVDGEGEREGTACVSEECLDAVGISERKMRTRLWGLGDHVDGNIQPRGEDARGHRGRCTK
jgi:hypothetical protein